MNYIIYNISWDIPSFHWHLIITTSWIDFYRWRITLTLIFLSPIMLTCFYLCLISKHFEAFRSKLSHSFLWEIPFSISYINGIEHRITVLLNNLVNLPPNTVDLEYGIAFKYGMDCVLTRMSWWEDLRDIVRQIGWILKDVVEKATPKDLNNRYKL